MRAACLLLAAVLSAGVHPAIAGEADAELFFPDITDQKIHLRRFDRPLDANANECPTAGKTCADLYSIDYVGTEVAVSSVRTPSIVRGHVDPNSDILELDLSEPITLNQAGTTLPLSSFRLVLRQIQLQGNPKPARLELSLGPTFFLDDDQKARSLIYRGLRFRTSPVGQVTVTLRDPDTGGTITYNQPDVTPYPRQTSSGNLLWHIELQPYPPRGKPFEVAVAGIDEFQSGGITRRERITFAPLPKGREDATFYLKGQKVYNHKDGNDQGSVDFKNGTTFFSPAAGQEWWYLLSATVGSKELKISQTGTASLGYRKWLGVNPNDLTEVSQWAVSAAPTFRTDRDFKNRDLGLDLMLTGEPALLYQPIERRRKNAATPQAATEIAAGWWVKPKFAIEAGEHLASSSDEVEGESFARGVAGLNLMWETDRLALANQPAVLKLTVDFAARYLSNDEVTIDQNNVLAIEDGYKPYLRAELVYDFGYVGLSVVHENGKIPPAFKTARATTAGLTFKF